MFQQQNNDNIASTAVLAKKMQEASEDQNWPDLKLGGNEKQ